MALWMLFAFATSAGAEQRVVRIIWDVGQKALYYRGYPVQELLGSGTDEWTVPKNAVDALAKKFTKYKRGRILQKDDRIRLYLVNYNPVAHVYVSTSVEFIEEPALPIGAILNAAILAITGATALPSVTPLFRPDQKPCPGDIKKLKVRVAWIEEQTRKLGSIARRITSEAPASLDAIKEKLSEVPTSDELWDEFDNQEAWDALKNYVRIDDFDTTLGKLVKRLEGTAKAVTSAVIAFDLDLADYENKRHPKNPTPKCANTLTMLKAGRKNVGDLYRDQAAVVTEATKTIATYREAEKLWDKYEKLLVTDWRDYAVQVILGDQTPESGVMVLDSIFKSPDKNDTRRAYRSATVGVQRYYPALLVSAGIGTNAFNFKKLAVVKQQSGEEGTTDKLIIIDDDSYEAVTPVWIESFRLITAEAAGIYATFGTTPDRNIFQDAILGISVYFPKARTAVTIGAIGASGLTEDDLQFVVQRFTVDGVAREKVTAANLELPDARWHWSQYFSVSFTIFSR